MSVILLSQKQKELSVLCLQTTKQTKSDECLPLEPRHVTPRHDVSRRLRCAPYWFSFTILSLHFVRQGLGSDVQRAGNVCHRTSRGAPQRREHGPHNQAGYLHSGNQWISNCPCQRKPVGKWKQKYHPVKLPYKSSIQKKNELNSDGGDSGSKKKKNNQMTLWRHIWWGMAEYTLGGWLESGGRFCVGLFGRNLA
jgi:hypothetical protein